MSPEMILQVLAILALVFSVGAFAYRLRIFNSLRRPVDSAPSKGSRGQGVFYAYTLGMMPWAKESTRRHAVAYLRGVGFHLGIFLGLAVFILSPWMSSLPALLRTLLAVAMGLGAILGLAGIAMRLMEPDLKAISTGDDFFAVLVVSLFQVVTSLWLAGALPAAAFYITSALMLVYAPFGKIRHCIYFTYSRLFYGKFMGTRAVLPHSQQHSAQQAGR